MANVDDVPIDQTLTDRLIDKGRKSPFLVAGLVSFAGICAYGAYNFKRKQTSTQLYLIQLRVAAQGTAIACLTFGMVYHMIKKHVLHDENEP
ncbi:PREDICTED: HIG1 domain family member 1A, mitochondrial-like [Dinoponera quadriceps]|uniref:HIG1 domain family member 1A, mitochondrial-like n=1 Tax=Dinoponera quadriceps TaxID=609295 RepID=A0A6P3XWX1_DINQU|nr:PREDICTED: HIG1 domain family member 1A, mitochondrial-like [Dinoponera quadriceps]XP_014482472.1 PREDICTED: HIG1 domain family member 1A, mitochondrial-like [Dinoponera quadriceps]XP_014482473.1 PREDICTED: HIG1 domain family member 1A, mitochondrial-like [Dinoponera quadriceps]XP_014482474.1 PREDICTED: HIG1 domain family member 1A, mitochondrial-like [Dinoponera quadriceps]